MSGIDFGRIGMEDAQIMSIPRKIVDAWKQSLVYYLFFYYSIYN